MIQASVNPYTIAQAGRNLGRFMIRTADRVARDVGFSYEPVNDAPQDYESPQAEYKRCQVHRIPAGRIQALPGTSNPRRPNTSAARYIESPQAEYKRCQVHRRAFRVWNGASDSTIYGSPEANYAFRFWHGELLGDTTRNVWRGYVLHDDDRSIARKPAPTLTNAQGGP